MSSSRPQVADLPGKGKRRGGFHGDAAASQHFYLSCLTGLSSAECSRSQLSCKHWIRSINTINLSVSADTVSLPKQHKLKHGPLTLDGMGLGQTGLDLLDRDWTGLDWTGLG